MFKKPQAEVVEFSNEDVILTSLMGVLQEDDPVEQPKGSNNTLF